MKALRNKVSDYLSSNEIDPCLAKFIIEKIDFTRSEGLSYLGNRIFNRKFGSHELVVSLWKVKLIICIQITIPLTHFI
jgi:hypothetical protein